MSKNEAFAKLITLREYFSKVELESFFYSMLETYVKENGQEEYCNFEEACIEILIPVSNFSYWSNSDDVKDKLINTIIDLFMPLLKKIYSIYRDNSEVLFQRLIESQEGRTLPNEYEE